MKENQLTNIQIREWYLEELAKIPEIVEQYRIENTTVKDIAYFCWKYRHDKRLEARVMMQHQHEIDYIRNLDRERYGNPDGPTFEYKIEEAKKMGFTGNDIYEKIILDSPRTNPGIDDNLLK